MNKDIVSAAKSMLEASREEYGKNFVVKQYQAQFDTPEGKKQVAAAELNMKTGLEKIAWLQKFIKDNSKA